jgi:hypothetical protein
LSRSSAADSNRFNREFHSNEIDERDLNCEKMMIQEFEHSGEFQSIEVMKMKKLQIQFESIAFVIRM